MKRIFYILTTLALAGTGCSNFMEREIDSFYNDERTFTSYDRTSRFLTNAYTVLSEGLNRISNSMYDAATDDAEEARESSSIQQFNNGSWSPRQNPDDVWNRFYSGIRVTNIFLENVDRVNLDAYRLDPSNQTEYQNRLKDLDIWKMEARFLRAYFHFELLKRYGPIPLITESLSVTEDYANLPRPTMDECVQFISDECDIAAEGLELEPWRNVTAGLGRATKGAALALKSRLLLYAASPLWLDWRNTSEDVLPSDPAKWKAAADAAWDVIDLGVYTLSSNYATLFTNNFENSEFILVRRQETNSAFESYNFPISYGGQGGTNPSLNLAEAYEKKDGSRFSWDNPGDAEHPNFNRDDRFAQTLLSNGDVWKGATVDTYIGGKDGPYNTNATKTGYYLRKFLNQDVNLLTGGGALAHTWPLFRLAEIYLNYAEALNECDPDNPDVAEYVNLVRRRGGQLDLPFGMDQEYMRERIRNERRIELAFEEHRAWDVRRWKIAGSTLGGELRGLEITPKTGSGSMGLTRSTVADIPAGEIPAGWYYYDGDEFNASTFDYSYHGIYGDGVSGNAQYGQTDHYMVQTYRGEQVTMAMASSGERVVRMTATRDGNPPASAAGSNVTGRNVWWSGALSSRDAYRYPGSQPLDKYYPLFMRMEVRAKIPYIYGYWPALWNRHYLGATQAAELDILEFFVAAAEPPNRRLTQSIHLWNNNTNTTQSNITPATGSRQTPIGFDPGAGFHVYGVQIEEDPADENHAIISYLLDGAVTNTFSTRPYGNQYNRFITRARSDNRLMTTWDICMNGGVGGKLSYPIGYPEDRDPILREIVFEVDWLRVFTRENLGPEPPQPPTPPVEEVTYRPFVVEQRVFQPKMYWYPIPEGELLKMKGWDQNPDW